MNYLELTDERLCALAKENDAIAIETLLNRYKNLVTVVARSFFLSDGSIEDLAQEGMIGAYHAIVTYNGAISFKNYAYTCIRSSILTAVKKATRKKHSPLNNYISLSGSDDADADKSFIMLDEGFNPETILIHREAEVELKIIIKETLSDLENKILALFLKGNSYQDIAQKIGKEVKSVDNALQRIRKKLSAVINLQ